LCVLRQFYELAEARHAAQAIPFPVEASTPPCQRTIIMIKNNA